MPDVDKDRVRKFIAHLDNENDGEAFNALVMVRKELAKSGHKIRDIPEIFSKTVDEFSEEIGSGYTEEEDDDVPEYSPESSDERRKAERQAEEEIARQRAEAAKAAQEAEERARAEWREALKQARDAMIAKYGSEDAVRRPKGLERSVRTAYSLAMIERRKDRERDGWPGFAWRGPDEGFHPPPELLAAIRKPGPFPTTVAAAYSEVQYWDGRIAERRLLEWNEGDWDVLSEECAKRQEMAREAFAYELRATTPAEVLLRQRALMDDPDYVDRERLQQAIVDDLEGIVASERAAEAPAVQVAHPSTAAARREEAIRMLSSPDASLSDREIARRLGMSNATVSSLRRRMAGEMMAKAA